ncbi:hypothetical protein [Bacillus toyonensis]|uniref:hypothetical protein n=1 Tax=Bacillus toyonensis TaxID=155322 RepID=UPI000BFCE72A|nr:hypothetical protein [Bacillus toyonensis]PHD38226.1 hypothetical protein COF48_00260 [Bacillus toyonensis]
MRKYIVNFYMDIVINDDQLHYKKEVVVKEARELKPLINSMLKEDFIEIESKGHELILLATKNISEVSILKNKEEVING